MSFIYPQLSISINPVQVRALTSLFWVIKWDSSLFLCLLFLFPVQLMYCCQIIFLNCRSGHTSTWLQKVHHFPLFSKSFNGVFEVIQRYVFNFPAQPYFSALLACTEYTIRSDFAFLSGQVHSFSACLPSTHTIPLPGLSTTLISLPAKILPVPSRSDTKRL